MIKELLNCVEKFSGLEDSGGQYGDLTQVRATLDTILLYFLPTIFADHCIV